jgi:hypothetical protein
MKATIKSDGTLVIITDNGLEHYALERWYEKNLKLDENKRPIIDGTLIQPKHEGGEDNG